VGLNPARFKEIKAMRTFPKIMLLAGCGILQTFGAVAPSSAADLAVTPARRVSHHAIHHYRAVAVRDLDGTPIIVRRLPPVVVSPYGWPVEARGETVAIPARRAQPTHYQNGEPVLPSYPRPWPPRLTARYFMLSGRS
jgi:hypothetical protein